jgi:hypothetical protein
LWLTSLSNLCFCKQEQEENLMKSIIIAVTTTCGVLFSALAMADSVVIAGPDGISYQRIDVELNWTQARDAAAAKSLAGAPGHLATLLTASQAAAADVARDDNECWLGATDEATEGNWTWITGELFWIGDSGGSTQSGLYANWDSGEPNDDDNQDALEWNSNDGDWDDVGLSNLNDCYIVQFDGETGSSSSSPIPAMGTKGLLLMSLMFGLLGLAVIRRLN